MAGRIVRRVRRVVVGAAVFTAVLGGGALAVSTVLTRLDATPRVTRCAALLEGTQWYLEPDQADTAGLLAGTALHRGLPARATTIAIATALQESKLRNLDHGDRDSLGIFQQRPSQGWGTPEQVTDPVYATNAFYDALVQVEGYEGLPITEAAQEVQRSGFPDAYAQHETRARAWASALAGYSPAAVTCTLPEPGGAGDAATVVARVERDLGVMATPAADGVSVVVDAAALEAVAGPDATRLGWAVAHWAVSVAQPLELTAVRHAGQAWSREDGAWAPVEAAEATPGQVTLVLAG